MKKLILAIFLLFTGSLLAMNGQSQFERIPSEIKSEIIKYLNLADLGALSSSSKSMRIALNPDWKKIFEKNLGPLEEGDPVSYLPGEEETEQNIDWKETFLNSIVRVIESNSQKVREGKFVGIPTSFSPDEFPRFVLLLGADLSNIDFTKKASMFFSAKLKGANFQNTKLLGTGKTFYNANISAADFRGATAFTSPWSNPPVTMELLKNLGAIWDEDNPPIVD